MFTSRFMSLRVLIFPLLFVVITRVTLCQSDFERRFKQRSPSNYDLCFTNSSICSEAFISEMGNCLEALEQTQSEGDFDVCICEMRKNRGQEWDTCSEGLMSYYNDQTLGIWAGDCKRMSWRLLRGGTLSGGNSGVCNCKTCKRL